MHTGLVAILIVLLLNCYTIGTILASDLSDSPALPNVISRDSQLPLRKTKVTAATRNRTTVTQQALSADGTSSTINDVLNTPICPSPLIIDPNWNLGGSQVPHCHHGCCVPCPMEYIYYPSGKLETGFRVTTFTRSFSGICMIFLVISFLVLPGKRRPPSTLILYSSIGVTVFSLVGLFPAKNPKQLQCADSITKSTMYNNHLCAVQGGLLIFGSFASCVWISVIIFNLYMHTVWNKNVLTHRYLYLSLVVWGYVALFTILPLTLGAVQYEFGELCLISQKLASSLFFYPMGVLVFPSLALHLWTCVWIVRVKSRTFKSHPTQLVSQSSSLTRHVRHRQAVLHTLQLQWRAMLLAFALSIALAFYWLFYFIYIGQFDDHSSSVNSEQARSWFACMMEGRGQDTCSAILEDYLPSYVLMIAAEFSVSCPGTIFFIVFGVQRRIYEEWRTLLMRHFGKRSSTGGGSQRDALDVDDAKWKNSRSSTLNHFTVSNKSHSTTHINDVDLAGYPGDDCASTHSLDAIDLSSDTDTIGHRTSEAISSEEGELLMMHQLHRQQRALQPVPPPATTSPHIYYPLSPSPYPQRLGPRFDQLTRAVGRQLQEERSANDLAPPPRACMPQDRAQEAASAQTNDTTTTTVYPESTQSRAQLQAAHLRGHNTGY